MPCNHDKLTTPFCPHCGFSPTGGPQEIIVFIRKYVAKSKRARAQHEAWLKSNRYPQAAERHAEQIEKHRDKMQKLEGWIKWIESKINQ